MQLLSLTSVQVKQVMWQASHICCDVISKYFEGQLPTHYLL